jgi:hypothetical protein
VIKQIRGSAGGCSPVSAAVERRSVFRPGRVTFKLMVSNACCRGGIFVLPLKPAMVTSESVETSTFM